MYRLGAVLIALVAVILLIQPARGQTPPPPPGGSTPGTTPTPSPTALPDAQSLLQSMNAADVAKKTAHMTFSGTLSLTSDIPGVSITGTITGKGDQNFVTNAYRETLTEKLKDTATKPPKTVTDRITEIFAHGHLAVRTNNKKFQCSPVSTGGPSGPVGNPTSGSGVTIANVGLTTVNGISAWDVRVTVSVPGSNGVQTTAVTLDVYINAADYTTVAETLNLPVTETFKVKKKKHRLTLTENVTVAFSQYGEALSFKLPKACKSRVKSFELAHVTGSGILFRAAQGFGAASTALR